MQTGEEKYICWTEEIEIRITAFINDMLVLSKVRSFNQHKLVFLQEE